MDEINAGAKVLVKRSWSLQCSPQLVLQQDEGGFFQVVGANCEACGEKTGEYPRVKGLPASVGREPEDGWANWQQSFVARGEGWVNNIVLMEWCERHSAYTQAGIAEWRAAAKKLAVMVATNEVAEQLEKGVGPSPKQVVMGAIQGALSVRWLGEEAQHSLFQTLFEAFENLFEVCYEAGQDSQAEFEENLRLRNRVKSGQGEQVAVVDRRPWPSRLRFGTWWHMPTDKG